MNKSNKKLLLIIFILLFILGIGSAYAFNRHQKSNTEVKTNQKNTKTSNRISHNKHQKHNLNNVSDKTKKNQESDSKITIPSQFIGNWYDGKNIGMTIDSDKISFPNLSYPSDSSPTSAALQKVITKNSSPLKLCNDRGPHGSYELYHNPNPNASGAEGGDGNAYWIGYLTVNGKKERVLALYQRQGAFQIFTSHPTENDQGFDYTVGDYEKYIGTKDLDSLKEKSTPFVDYQKDNKSKSNNNSDTSNSNDSKNNNNDNSDTSNNNQSNNSDNDSTNNDSDNPDDVHYDDPDDDPAVKANETGGGKMTHQWENDYEVTYPDGSTKRFNNLTNQEDTSSN